MPVLQNATTQHATTQHATTQHATTQHATTQHAAPFPLTPDAAKVRVVVTDAVGLQRVLTLLLGRNHAFTRLEAEEAGGGRWTISLDLALTLPRIELLTARLHRLPSVLTVDVTSAGAPAPTGAAAPARR